MRVNVKLLIVKSSEAVPCAARISDASSSSASTTAAAAAVAFDIPLHSSAIAAKHVRLPHVDGGSVASGNNSVSNSSSTVDFDDPGSGSGNRLRVQPARATAPGSGAQLPGAVQPGCRSPQRRGRRGRRWDQVGFYRLCKAVAQNSIF